MRGGGAQSQPPEELKSKRERDMSDNQSRQMTPEQNKSDDARGEISSDSHSKPGHIFAPMSSEAPLPEIAGTNRSYFQGVETTLFESSNQFSFSAHREDAAHAPQDATEMMQKFYVFLNEFETTQETFRSFSSRASFPPLSQPKPYKPYMLQMRRLALSQEQNLFLNCEHLYERIDYLPLYKLLVWEPQYSLHLFDSAAKALFKEEHPNITEDRRIRVVPFNLATTKQLRDIGNHNILSLVQIEGIVIRMSHVTPTLMIALFQCTQCQREERIRLFGEKITEPQQCACGGRYTMEIRHERCSFIDRQTVKLQEMPESVPQGETPLSVLMVVHDDMVDQVRPGDRVKVVGVLRAEPRRESLTRRTVKMLFENFLDVISYSRLNSRRQLKFGAPGADLGFLDRESLIRPGESEDESTSKKLIFSTEEEDAIRALAQDPNLYNKLSEAIAPSIFECLDVKKGLLMQLFGAKEKKFSQSGRGRFRSEINILLIGDPSTAKSQLLQFVNKISPRGIYTSGKGSSAVGLTAYVKRDPETSQPVLESGALVLSDRGICCIDEFDKMSENARSVLHEVMEQQTVSIAKAGVVCQLNARSAVLAAANPVFSRYNKNLTVVKNLNLPPSLLSRFDLIYLMLDKYQESVDRQLSRHILSMYSKDSILYSANLPGREEPQNKGKVPFETQVEPALLCAYISYARDRIKPQLTDKACDIIRESYLKMRSIGNQNKAISATTRQIESLIRLSEAHARMRLSEEVEEEDAKEAVRLIEVATQKAATTPDGKIDMGRIQSGLDEQTRNSLKGIVADIQRLMKEYPSEFKSGVRYNQLCEYFQVLNERKMKENDQPEDIEILYALYELEADEQVILVGNRNHPSVKTVPKKDS